MNSSYYMGVSKNNGTPKSSILIGFSIINHPFWDSYLHPCFGRFFVNYHLQQLRWHFAPWPVAWVRPVFWPCPASMMHRCLSREIVGLPSSRVDRFWDQLLVGLLGIFDLAS